MHTARLKESGKEVVIKVIRPDILPIIKADMKLIYRLARWVPRLLPDGRRLRPQEVVREYENAAGRAEPAAGIRQRHSVAA